MDPKRFKLKRTTAKDKWGEPRQDYINLLETGEQLKLEIDYKFIKDEYDNEDLLPFLFVETSEGVDIGELSPDDSEYFIRRADNYGDIVLCFLDELKLNTRTENYDVYVRIEVYKPKDAKKLFPGVFDDYNEFERKRPPIYSKLRGVEYENADGSKRQDIIRDYVKAGDYLTIIHDSDNASDPNALAVYTEQEGLQLGYLSRDLAERMCPAVKNSQKIECLVKEVTGLDDPNKTLGVNVKLTVLTRKETEKLAKTPTTQQQVTSPAIKTHVPAQEPQPEPVQEPQPQLDPEPEPVPHPIPAQPPQQPTWQSYQQPPAQTYQPPAGQPWHPAPAQYQTPPAKPNLFQKFRRLPTWAKILIILLIIVLLFFGSAFIVAFVQSLAEFIAR